MEDSLKTLISYYKEEKGRLIHLIADCLIEKEYELAHFHQQALHQVNEQLNTFLRFEDCHFYEKESTKRQITLFENQIDGTLIIELREYLQKQVEKLKEKLEHLSALPKQENLAEDSTILISTINDLLEKKLKGIRIVLSKREKFYLDLSYTKNNLKIFLPNIRRLTDKWILNEDNLQSLILFGFQFIADGKSLELKLNGDKNSILFRLNVILSKMIFELFRTLDYRNESYIIIKVKAGCK